MNYKFISESMVVIIIWCKNLLFYFSGSNCQTLKVSCERSCDFEKNLIGIPPSNSTFLYNLLTVVFYSSEFFNMNAWFTKWRPPRFHEPYVSNWTILMNIILREHRDTFSSRCNTPRYCQANIFFVENLYFFLSLHFRMVQQ